MTRRVIIIAAIYLAMVVVTFGHSAASWTGAICNKGDWNEGPCDAPASAIGGIVAAVFWPLYWSWEAQE